MLTNNNSIKANIAGLLLSIKEIDFCLCVVCLLTFAYVICSEVGMLDTRLAAPMHRMLQQAILSKFVFIVVVVVSLFLKQFDLILQETRLRASA